MIQVVVDGDDIRKTFEELNDEDYEIVIDAELALGPPRMSRLIDLIHQAVIACMVEQMSAAGMKATMEFVGRHENSNELH